METIKTAPGKENLKLVAEGESIRAELKHLRAKFSAIYGSPDTEVKGLQEVEAMLEQAGKSPAFAKMADQQSTALQVQLVRFRVEMARLHNEALSVAMALDPDLEYNTKEVVDKATSKLQKRQDLYIKKL